MTKTKTAQVAVVENKEIVETKPNQLNPEALIEMAIKQGLPVETMERLLAMRKELRSEWAKEQYDIAMSNFQRDCPVIDKSSKVKDKYGKDRYSFAKLEDIVKQTKDIISDNGFSYKIEISSDDQFLTATCIVTHKDGHKEFSPFKVPISKEDYMSDVQKYGARSTFAKRYAFCNAFGIMTGDEDNDSNTDEDSVANGGKTKKKPVPTTTEEKKAMILEAVRTNKNSAGIITIDERVQASEEFDQEFKDEVHKLASKRVDELEGTIQTE